MFSCKKDKTIFNNLDVQGHRGCRGLMPENSIPAMQKALELGVNTLEMDVVISKDHKVLVSHEPFFNSEICLDLAGANIHTDSSESLNIYKMNYSDILKYDCGSKSNRHFPRQKQIAAHKQLLSEVILLANNFAEDNTKRLCNFNIEIKSRAQWDNTYHPSVSKYCDLVIAEIFEYNIQDFSTIQSFDPRVLKYINKTYPQIKLVYLLEDVGEWSVALKELGFKPEVISPYFALLNANIVNEIQSEGILVIPWTVNNKKDIKAMLKMGVNGIISDYPDILMEEMKGLSSSK